MVLHRDIVQMLMHFPSFLLSVCLLTIKDFVFWMYFIINSLSNLFLQEYMVFRQHTYMRLDGSSKISERRDMVADFQTRYVICRLQSAAHLGETGCNMYNPYLFNLHIKTIGPRLTWHSVWDHFFTYQFLITSVWGLIIVVGVWNKLTEQVVEPDSIFV